MGDLRVTIEHGSGLSGLLNGKTVLLGAAVVVIGMSGGFAGAISGLIDLLCWVVGIIFLAVAVGAWLMIRAMRRGRSQDYIRSVHGPTERDILIDKTAELAREIRLARAARYQLEVAQRMNGHFPADYARAEVIEP